MGHSCIRLKVRRRKVANLASQSRAHTVKNCKIPSTNKDFYTVPCNTVINKLTRFNSPFVHAGTVFIVKKRDKNGIIQELVKPDYSWKEQKHPQTKNLRKKVVVNKPKFEKVGDKLLFVGYEKKVYKSEYPDYTPKKMTHEEYIEKYIQHKMKKWERKNPRPVLEDESQKDLFEATFMIPWNSEYTAAKERIRDFVVSVYGKANLYSRHAKNGEYTHEEHMTELKEDSKMVEKAVKLVTEKSKKDKSVTSGRLQYHDKKHGRIVLPNSKKAVTLKDIKKAA